MKLSLFLFFLFCFSAVVFGGGSSGSESSQLENSTSSPNLNPTPNPNPSEDSKCSFKCEDFKALEQENRQLKTSLAEIIEKVKLLSQKVDGLESRISEDSGVSLLTTRLRGPPGKDGKQGEKGDKGEAGKDGKNGQPGPKGERGFSAHSITSCEIAMKSFPSSRSKKQTIYPHGYAKKVDVLCDFETDGGGWTIIQKRSSGPKQEFSRNWNEYANGFGSLDKNLWLGLDNIHALTKNGDQELRIELEDFKGEKRWAKYSNFSISDATDFYRLSHGGFYRNSTLKDSLLDDGSRFTTKDQDNDNHEDGNCAELRGGAGWWFRSGCGYCNLNGLYFKEGETAQRFQGIWWNMWHGHYYSMAKTEMKIRPRKS